MSVATPSTGRRSAGSTTSTATATCSAAACRCRRTNSRAIDNALLIVIAGAALAGFVQGLSGFGFSLTAMSIWAWALEPRLAAVLAVCGALTGQVIAAFRLRRHWDLPL